MGRQLDAEMKEQKSAPMFFRCILSVGEELEHADCRAQACAP
jgi:hypothetical protein